MPACDQVKLLLGPFDDGELEPHEMEDVAMHVVSCAPCKAALEDCRALGLALRDCLPQPVMAGFTAAVMKRIEQVPQPLLRRGQQHFDRLVARMGASIPFVAAGAFAAVLTVWLVTPYAQHWLHHSAGSGEVAGSNPVGQRTELTGSTVPDPADSSMITLSADPSVAVIWLPNQ